MIKIKVIWSRRHMILVGSSALIVKNGPLYKYMFRAIKLVSVLITSSLVTGTSKEDYMLLERVPYIHYPLCFQKNTTSIKTLIDLVREVNAMILIL